jgi:putative peptide zinc metalloprotease protein
LSGQLTGLKVQIAELEIRAPFTGVVAELAPALQENRWINTKEAVAVIRGHDGVQVRGYVDAADVWRIAAGAQARFVPDDVSSSSLLAELRGIAQASIGVIDQLELAGSFGGRIADRLDARHQPVPVTAQYPVRAAVLTEIPAALQRRTVTGLLVVEGQAESLLARIWRQALKVLVRESRI